MNRVTNRRNFLRAAATAAALTAGPKVLGANDRIRLGVIGSGERGRFDMSQFLAFPDVEVMAICDAWDESLAKAQAIIAKANRSTASEFADYRALLDRKDIDAVLIATPDHWHKDVSIAACQAGKDVYVEKPLTLKPEEGPAIVAAARDNKRVVQVGMQQRSGDHYKQAKETYFDTKKIGKVTLARTWWHGNTYHLRKCPFQDKPTGLDWNRFVGPLSPRPWDPQQFWNWRAYLDFGGGQITDLFTHWIDVVHWFMGQDLPTAAVASGGVYNYKDGRTAPDTINVLLEYPGEWTATFEATLVPGARGAGIEFLGSEGRLNITRAGYTFTPLRGDPVEVKAGPGDPMTLNHVDNFLHCVRSRSNPNGDVEIGHRSALASHLGNIAALKKQRIVPDKSWV
jgi:predicted dehydrogenase